MKAMVLLCVLGLVVGCGASLTPRADASPLECYLDADQRAWVAQGEPDPRPARCFIARDAGEVGHVP